MMRAPVCPKGCPRAIAPPLTFSLSQLMPKCFADGMTCAANASLISTRSMSSIVMLARAEDLTAGVYRSQSHDLGIQSRDAAGHDAGQGRDAQFLGLGIAHHDHRSRAVVERAGVPGGDGAAFAEDRLEVREALEGGAGPRPVVLGDDRPVGQGDRDDLSLEEAVLLVRHRACL